MSPSPPQGLLRDSLWMHIISARSMKLLFWVYEVILSSLPHRLSNLPDLVNIKGMEFCMQRSPNTETLGRI